MESTTYLEEYQNKGYAIIRNFMNPDDIAELGREIDQLLQEGLQHKSSFRHQNLYFLIQPDANLGKILRFCQWPSYKNKVFEKYRTDDRYRVLMEPLLGENIKQIINQVIWKMPGSTQTSYGYHQDSRFRRPESAYRQLGTSFVQTALAIDPHTRENGCLTFIEKSHLAGNLKFITKNSVFQENITDEVLDELGFSDHAKVDMILEPGDLVIWHPFLLHGSRPNTTMKDRRTFLNGYVTAENCDRGEWAFKQGKAIPLGEPQLVQFEALHEKSEPHYIS